MSRARRPPDTPPAEPEQELEPTEEETPEAVSPEEEQVKVGDRPPEPVERPTEPEEAPVSSSTRRKRSRALERRIHDWLGRLETTDDEPPVQYATGLAGLLYVVDPFDGTIVAMHAPNMARAYAALADESPRFARFLELAMSGGATGAAIFATLPPLLAIAAHHGIDLTAPLRQIQARRGSTFGTIPVEPDGTAHVTEPASPPPPVA